MTTNDAVRPVAWFDDQGIVWMTEMAAARYSKGAPEPLYSAESIAHLQARVEALTGEVERLRSYLQRIADLNPEEDSENGFNEWGEADCFRVAQNCARAALTQPEADHG